MQRFLGVRYSEGSLRASLVEARFRTASVIKTEAVDLPDGDERDTLIVESLSRWKKELGPRAVIFGLPLGMFSHQMIEMPYMNKADMQRALTFELEKHLPLPVDEYVFDFIPVSPAKGVSQVLTMSIRRSMVDRFVKYARDAGMAIHSINCTAVAEFCDFLDMAGQKQPGGVLVNVKDRTFDITAFDKGRPRMFRSYRGRSDLAAGIEKALELCPGKVWYTGEMDEQIADRFKGRKVHPDASKALAMSVVRKPGVDLNFLPAELIVKEKDRYPLVLGGLSAAAVLLFLLTGTISYVKDRNTAHNIGSRLAAVQKRGSRLIEDKKKLETLREDRKFLLSFRAESNVTVLALRDLSRTVPENAWLISMSLDDKGNVEIEGFTKDTSALIMALEKSEAFKNVTFSSPIITKEGEERFSLKMEVEKK